jgi:hypothetical protein
MKKILNRLKSKLSAFLEPQPEIEDDYVDKIVYLLRRDFSSKEQNKILQSVATKLTALRNQDMLSLEKEYMSLKEQTTLLKGMITS